MMNLKLELGRKKFTDEGRKNLMTDLQEMINNEQLYVLSRGINLEETGEIFYVNNKKIVAKVTSLDEDTMTVTFEKESIEGIIPNIQIEEIDLSNYTLRLQGAFKVNPDNVDEVLSVKVVAVYLSERKGKIIIDSLKTLNNFEESDDRTTDRYETLRELVVDNFEAIASRRPVFRTDTVDLWETFLNRIPLRGRQHYDCNCCKSFIRRLGDLVYVNGDGTIESALWTGDVPEFFKPAVDAMLNKIRKSSIMDEFKSDHAVEGTPVSDNGWTHFYLEIPDECRNRSHKTAFEVMAEKVQDLKLMKTTLSYYDMSTVRDAVTLFESAMMFRNNKCLGTAKWLEDLMMKLATTQNNKIQHNILWEYVATAPTGFAHLKNGMVGTVLDDLLAGKSIETIVSQYTSKMEDYQRPQSDPSKGNVINANKLMEKLGYDERSLMRRFLRKDEAELMWQPQTKETEVVENKEGGMFDHLMPKEEKKENKRLVLPTVVNITWDKFNKTVLPDAEKIEFHSYPYIKNNYCGLVTALHYDAKPIISWDDEENRNPVSSYVYKDGTQPALWNINTTLVEVTGICTQPSSWHNRPVYPNADEFILFILDGAKDTNLGHPESKGNCLFPEIVKSELREIRKTIEAYSASSHLEGFDEASACGVALHKGTNHDLIFTVTTDRAVTKYKIDRWD